MQKCEINKLGYKLHVLGSYFDLLIPSIEENKDKAPKSQQLKWKYFSPLELNAQNLFLKSAKLFDQYVTNLVLQ